jgi:signal transduction histidine kinase
VEPKVDYEQLPPEWVEGRPPRMWGRHGFWQVQIRWAVLPIMVVGLLIGRALGFEFETAAILIIGVACELYNAFFAWIFSRNTASLEQDPQRERFLSLLEVSADYLAIFLLIYFTGGVSSPLVVFLIFHVIITAIQFSASTAYTLAGLAAGALWLLLLAQVQGWIGQPIFAFKGLPITLLDRPVYAAVLLLSFTATLFISAAMTARVMRRLRQRVGDLRQAYEAVEVLLAERARVMLEVAHNLRAPLAAGLSTLDLVTAGYVGELSEQQREHLERVALRLRTLDKAIGQLLTIARARDWSREIPDVVVDLNELARTTESTFREDAEAKQLRFRVDAEPDLPSLPSGSNLLEQVMENLVSNAIKYTPEGGSVSVRFARNGPAAVRIEVEDTGIGIPAAEQEKLFREFFRASNAKKASRDGTGLGLALTRRAVERHGGTIIVNSEEDHGTIVVVDLPLERDKPTVSP